MFATHMKAMGNPNMEIAVSLVFEVMFNEKMV